MRNPGVLEEYYARRAAEYERIYAIPERQDEIKLLVEVLVSFARGRRLLEIACGTGYWTEILAGAAAEITCIDSVTEVLEVARQKGLPSDRVRFVCADAFSLDEVPGDFEAGFAGFWWSHVGRERLAEFLAVLHRRLGPGARMLFFDNKFVPGSSAPITRTDAAGNSYQERVLGDGSSYEILKNFPSLIDLRERLAAAGSCAIQICELKYYWYASYEIGSSIES
jgi:demethylmenaquinone methyltransferase/2-methoxy-6-polyprenyl-1,4-benzoquinol methylase